MKQKKAIDVLHEYVDNIYKMEELHYRLDELIIHLRGHINFALQLY